MKFPSTLRDFSCIVFFLSFTFLSIHEITAQEITNPDILNSTDKIYSAERSIPSAIFTLTNTLTPPDEYFEYLDLNQGGNAYMEQVSPGVFHIYNLKPFSQYSIKLNGTGPMELGVSTLDISLILMHILGISTLDPIKLIAADANGDGRVSAADLVDIRRLILGKTPAFSIGVSWKFVPELLDFMFTGSTIDLGNILAIKVGHVN